MSFFNFDPGIFVLVRELTPSQTSLNRFLWVINHYRITLEIELYITLNSCGTVKTYKLTGLPILFELVAVVS